MVTAVLVVVGLLLADQIHQRQQFDRTRASLNLTRQHVASVSGQLSAVRRQLHLVSTQVGNDTHGGRAGRLGAQRRHKPRSRRPRRT